MRFARSWSSSDRTRARAAKDGPRTPIPSRASTMTGAPVESGRRSPQAVDGREHGDGRRLGLAAGEVDPVGYVAGSQSNRNRPVPGGPLGRPAGQLLECGRQLRQAVSLPLRTRGHQLAEFRHRGERTLPGDSAPATRMQSGVEKTGEGDDRTEKREQEGERRAGHRPDRHRDPERGDHRHDGKRRPCRRRVEGGESESLGLRKVRHPVSPAQGRPLDRLMGPSGSARADGTR